MGKTVTRAMVGSVDMEITELTPAHVVSTDCVVTPALLALLAAPTEACLWGKGRQNE